MNLITLYWDYLKMISQFLNEFITIDINLISWFFILLLSLAILNFMQFLLPWRIWTHKKIIGTYLLSLLSLIPIIIFFGIMITSSFTQSISRYKSKYTDKAKDNSKSKDQKQSKSFVLPFLFSFLKIEIYDSSSRIIQLANGVFLLSIVSFVFLLNVFFYSTVYLLIQQSSYETRFPRLLWFMNFYKTTSLLYIVFGAILVFVALLLLIGFSLMAIFSGVN